MSKKDSIAGLLSRKQTQQTDSSHAKREVMDSTINPIAAVTSLPTANEELAATVETPTQTAMPQPIPLKELHKATFEMDRQLHKRLKIYSARNEIPMVNVVEEALKLYLDTHPDS